MFPHLLFQEVGKIRQFKNLHSRKLPGREGSGIRKANWKVFSQYLVFWSRTRERDPRIPASISQKDFPAARKAEGKRKGIRKGKYQKAHFQSNCLGTRPIPGFVSRPFPGRKWITYSKPPSPGRSPEGKRVFPGRQTGRVIFENSVW